MATRAQLESISIDMMMYSLTMHHISMHLHDSEDMLAATSPVCARLAHEHGTAMETVVQRLMVAADLVNDLAHRTPEQR